MKKNPENQTSARFKTPYTRFEGSKLILRDELAIDRTLLANERTLMAYLRSGIALAIAGVTIIHFSEKLWFWIIGLGCLPVSFFTLLIGIIRYRKMSARIAFLRNRNAGNEGNPLNPLSVSEAEEA